MMSESLGDLSAAPAWHLQVLAQLCPHVPGQLRCEVSSLGILQLTSALCCPTNVGKAASTVAEGPHESLVQRPRTWAQPRRMGGLEDGEKMGGWEEDERLGGWGRMGGWGMGGGWEDRGMEGGWRRMGGG